VLFPTESSAFARKSRQTVTVLWPLLSQLGLAACQLVVPPLLVASPPSPPSTLIMSVCHLLSCFQPLQPLRLLGFCRRPTRRTLAKSSIKRVFRSSSSKRKSRCRCLTSASTRSRTLSPLPEESNRSALSSCSAHPLKQPAEPATFDRPSASAAIPIPTTQVERSDKSFLDSTSLSNPTPSFTFCSPDRVDTHHDGTELLSLDQVDGHCPDSIDRWTLEADHESAARERPLCQAKLDHDPSTPERMSIDSPSPPPPDPTPLALDPLHSRTFTSFDVPSTERTASTGFPAAAVSTTSTTASTSTAAAMLSTVGGLTVDESTSPLTPVLPCVSPAPPAPPSSPLLHPSAVPESTKITSHTPPLAPCTAESLRVTSSTFNTNAVASIAASVDASSTAELIALSASRLSACRSDLVDDCADKGNDQEEELWFDIAKGSRPLGLQLIAARHHDRPILLIHELIANGAAAFDGRIRVGDVLRQVDEQPLHTSDVQFANTCLNRSLSQVRLLIQRVQVRLSDLNDAPPTGSPPLVFDSCLYQRVIVTLNKRAGRPLGLSLLDRCTSGPGPYITEIQANSVVQQEGSLRVGDHVLTVNGIDVSALSSLSGSPIASSGALMALKSSQGIVQIQVLLHSSSSSSSQTPID
jgi:hypothetical protein